MKNNLHRNLHHKLLFTVTFLLPSVLCILIGLIHFDNPSFRVGVITSMQDGSRVTYGSTLDNILMHSPGLKYEEADPLTMHTDLMTGKYHLVLDFRGCKKMDDFHLVTYQNNLKSDLWKKAFQKAILNREAVLFKNLENKGITPTQRTMATLLTFFMIFATIYTSAMIKDRQNSILSRYRYSGKTSGNYILGYFFSSLLIIYMQSLFCILILRITQKNFDLNFMQITVLSVMIAVISVIFSILICCGSRSEVEANIMAAALSSVLSLLGGTFVAVEAMPELLKILSYASPIRWVIELIKIL
jgi:ABC-type multidrug transport system, permease component